MRASVAEDMCVMLAVWWLPQFGLVRDSFQQANFVAKVVKIALMLRTTIATCTLKIREAPLGCTSH